MRAVIRNFFSEKVFALFIGYYEMFARIWKRTFPGLAGNFYSTLPYDPNLRTYVSIGL